MIRSILRTPRFKRDYKSSPGSPEPGRERAEARLVG